MSGAGAAQSAHYHMWSHCDVTPVFLWKEVARSYSPRVAFLSCLDGQGCPSPKPAPEWPWPWGALRVLPDTAVTPTQPELLIASGPLASFILSLWADLRGVHLFHLSQGGCLEQHTWPWALGAASDVHIRQVDAGGGLDVPGTGTKEAGQRTKPWGGGCGW